jgi:hypothetical protein
MHICSPGDPVLGNPVDVHRWRLRLKQTQALAVLSPHYSHNSMLMDDGCEQEHFRDVLAFMDAHCGLTRS